MVEKKKTFKKTAAEKLKLREREVESTPEIVDKLNTEINPLISKFDKVFEKIINVSIFDEVHEKRVKELHKIQKKYRETIQKIEEDYSLTFYMGDKSEEFPDSSIEWGAAPPVEKEKVSGNFLHLRINLTCDKKDIHELLDTILDGCRKKANINENELTLIKRDKFAKFFKKNYLKTKNKQKAIENTVADFHKEGIETTYDTLEKNYYRRFKKDENIRNIRDLLKKDK